MRHKLSEIEIKRMTDGNGFIGYASFVVDGNFRFKSVAIYSRVDGGIRLSWPEKIVGTHKIKTGSPTKPESFLDIEAQILKAMKEENKAHN